MFTFRKLTVLFFILLFTLNVIHFVGCRMDWISGHLCNQTYIYIVALFSLYIGISVIMAFFINSNFHHSVICKARTTDKICALTFDDGPDPAYTKEILKILERKKLSATFFVIGRNLAGNEPLVQQMVATGHQIGIHSWTHSVWFDFFTGKRMKLELEDTSNAILRITGKRPILFRPPYGVINPTLSNVLKKLEFHVIGWNVRSFDTLRHGQNKIVCKILKKVSPGSIILLHDNLPGSPLLLEKLSDELLRMDYSIVPITQLLQIEAYA